MADEIVGSKMPAKNGYGQNGFQGPSSDTDLSKPTRSPLSVNVFGPTADLEVKDDNGQTRNVSAKGYPPSYGHKNLSNTGPKVPSKLNSTQPDPIRSPASSGADVIADALSRSDGK